MEALQSIINYAGDSFLLKMASLYKGPPPFWTMSWKWYALPVRPSKVWLRHRTTYC